MAVADSPVYSVTELVKCRFFKPPVPDSVVERLRREGINAHKAVQDRYLEECGGECEAERKIRARIGEIELVGKVDIIDYRRNLVVELKPMRSMNRLYRIADLYQLSVYISILRREERIYFNGMIGYYTVNRRTGTVTVHMMKPFVLCTDIIKDIERYSATLAYIKRNNLPYVVRGKWCKYCVLKEVARPDAAELIWGRDNICDFEAHVPPHLRERAG